MKTVIDTYCGLSRAECDTKENNQCNGCIASEGDPSQGGCEIAECVKKKNLQFCGECEHLPCEIISRYSNDEEHGDHPKGARIERCKMLKAALVKEARAGKNPIAYCGFNCDACFYKDGCGGCRSDYNCCSFATLFEDRLCPNVTCAKDKGINGCYECNELTDCVKGFYSRSNDGYLPKAAALFIKEYGAECSANALRKAIADGVKLEESGSLENALNTLKKYK